MRWYGKNSHPAPRTPHPAPRTSQLITNMKKSLFFAIALYILSACAPAVYTEVDKVTGTRFVKCEMYLTNNDFREPGYSQKLIVVKETKRNEEPVFNWYDVLTMSVENFEVDTKDMYLIVDDEVFPLENSYEKRLGERNVNEKKEEVMQADSSKVSVVTGYDVVQKNVYQMTHPVSAEVMGRILDANEVILRYTVGPRFINSEINGKNLVNLKQLIAK